MKVPILIIGGGGCGLSLSSFLSDANIEHVLFEKHASTSILPKAHYLNQRTMEICRQHGMDNAIRAVGCPLHHMGRVEWKTSLGGTGPYDRRVLGHVPSFGGTYGTPSYDTYR
jgi:2,4-dichlorophenol 6-monooxygenase